MQIVTRIAAGAASAAVLLGSAVLTASTASAASLPKACNLVSTQNKNVSIAVNLRSGPGTKYKSLGILYKGARFTEYCNKDYKWSYGKVTSGPNKGKKGWVKYSYLNPVETN
ncbi:SH3 domain-containing protein [Streptomyces fulvoviolaceus]|uniref:SH3 domain-containing protein n=1 Tax=Streptomyces fulvoviolaceus TaxID=285535 RepID=UPI0021C0F5F9|nr:SH3 domain-containing protein [Streptomyces fulvoviolaceus]MCT9077177.1 SH3 domain-containing protein [Streptomyces fulvoviolaceus]